MLRGGCAAPARLPPNAPPTRPPPQSSDKALRLCNDFWHIIVREPGNERINADIAAWLLQRAAQQ